MLIQSISALDLPEGIWKNIETKTTDGVTRKVYNRSQNMMEFDVVFSVDISEAKTFRSYSQNILVIKDGVVYADVIISYSKNGSYVYQVRVAKNKGPVNYGRIGSANNIDDLDREYVSIDTGTDNNSIKLIFVRRNELFESVLDDAVKENF
jgi:hypothetical protein